MFKPGVTIGLWFLGLVFAFANGVAGKLVYEPLFGEAANHIVKTAVGVVFMLFLGWLHAGFTRGSKALKAGWITGIIWAVATALVELPIFVYVRNIPWGEAIPALLETYYIWEGQLWPLVLAALLIGPPLFAALRKNAA
jgi:hypothetical protein